MGIRRKAPIRLYGSRIRSLIGGALLFASVVLLMLPAQWGIPIAVGLGMAVWGAFQALLMPWLKVERRWERAGRPPPD